MIKQALKPAARPGAHVARLRVAVRIKMAKNVSTGELTGDKWDDTVQSVAKQIFNGRMRGPISDDMVTQIATELMKGVYSGYGMSFDSPGLAATDFDMLRAIEKNVFLFSGFKNETELREVSDLLKDGNKVRSFEDWFDGVKKIDATYNKVYARTEYNTATTTAISISREQTFQREKETLPYVEWVATGDEAECDVCKDLDGTILPVDDPFWDTHGNPAHFNCMCIKVQRGPHTKPTPEDEVKYPNYPSAWKMFQTNAAKTGVIFPEKHPYFTQSKNQKAVIDAVTKLIPERTPPRQFADNLTTVAKAISQPVNHTSQAIDAVLSLPEIPKVSVAVTRADNFGSFDPNKDRIFIRPDGDHPELTMAHETGHYLDFYGSEKLGYESMKAGNGQWKEVFDAIRQTESYKIWHEAATTGKYAAPGRIIWLDYKSKKLLKYLASDVELWARAFSQYIAYKSGDKKLIAQCLQMAEWPGISQWKEDDFKNVIFAMDKKFDELGWLIKK